MKQSTFEADVIEFGQSVGALVRRARAAAASHDLSWTETSVLKRLVDNGPATIADLARLESMRPQSMGTVVATLEEAGMVRRTPHPTDGRQMNVAITAKGTAVRQSVGDAKRTWLAQAFLRLDERERKTLFAAGQIMRKLVEL